MSENETNLKIEMPNITCFKCKAVDVPLGWYVEFTSDELREISQAKYGVTKFELCPNCAVDCFAKACGAEE